MNTVINIITRRYVPLTLAAVCTLAALTPYVAAQTTIPAKTKLHAVKPSADLLGDRGLPRILYNNDGEDLSSQAYYPIVTQSTGKLWVPNGNHIPVQPIASLDDYLAYRLGPLVNSPVKGLSYCGNFGSAIWDLKREGSVAAGRDNLAALGDDPLQPILNWWKRDGRTFFFSIRMNDLHQAWMNFPSMWDSVRRAQRHLFLKPPTEEEWQTQFVPWLTGKGPFPYKFGPSSTNFGYDYSLPEVREHYLGILREACRRYDLDGVEFDWLRAAIYFRKGEVNAQIITGFVGQAHAILAEAAKRRGHPVRLVCRVPDTPGKALDVGLDVGSWLKAGWIDAVIAGDGDFFSACGIDQWVTLAHRHEVPVYGVLERASWGEMRFARFGSPETLRAAVATLYQKGADGIYLFNFYAKEEYPLLTDFSDPARLARLPKEYFLDPDYRRLPGLHLTGMLSNGTRAQGPIPVECKSGETASTTLIIADDPTTVKDFRLELVWKGSDGFAPPGVSINGHALNLFTTERGNGSLIMYSTSPELAKLLRRAANEFVFTSASKVTLTALGLRITPESPTITQPVPKWTAQAAEDAKQDFTSIPFDGITPNKLACDATLRELPDGSWVMAMLGGGDSEPLPQNQVFLTRSIDAGKTWSPMQPLDFGFPREGNTIAMVPSELMVHAGRSTLFVASHDGKFAGWKEWMTYSEDNCRTWSKPEAVPGRLHERTFVRNHMVARDGRIMLPFQHYLDAPSCRNPRNGVLISADGGKTWTEHGDIRISNDDTYYGWAENNIAELADGRIAMIIRADRLGGVLYYAESKDGGKTWPKFAVKSDIPNPGSKATLYPLGGDTVALLHNPNPNGRYPLALWISFDGMKTWQYQRVLVEHSSDGPGRSLNYPDGFVSKDKQWLHFAYDDNRHRAVHYSAKLPPLSSLP